MTFNFNTDDENRILLQTGPKFKKHGKDYVNASYVDVCL